MCTGSTVAIRKIARSIKISTSCTDNGVPWGRRDELTPAYR
jgi:hypothetical protein